MKKKTLSLIVILTVIYSDLTIASSMKTINTEPNWKGFYIGGNAGYWKSQSNKIATTGSSSFINQSFPLGASNIAHALAKMANNNFSLYPSGFIGGGQAGYNYPYNNEILVGFEVDLDGLSQSANKYTLQKTVNLTDFNESYGGSFVVKQKINYLGTVRARLGYLYHPTLLIYALGGFAYGNVAFNTAWTVQESLGPSVFPTIVNQNNFNRTLPGWTAGAGIEWLFQLNWSAKLEYTYYSLSKLHAPVTLSQFNSSLSPSTLWGSAVANTTFSSLSLGTIRFGINYHFT